MQEGGVISRIQCHDRGALQGEVGSENIAFLSQGSLWKRETIPS